MGRDVVDLRERATRRVQLERDAVPGRAFDVTLAVVPAEGDDARRTLARWRDALDGQSVEVVVVGAQPDEDAAASPVLVDALLCGFDSVAVASERRGVATIPVAGQVVVLLDMRRATHAVDVLAVVGDLRPRVTASTPASTTAGTAATAVTQWDGAPCVVLPQGAPDELARLVALLGHFELEVIVRDDGAVIRHRTDAAHRGVEDLLIR